MDHEVMRYTYPFCIEQNVEKQSTSRLSAEQILANIAQKKTRDVTKDFTHFQREAFKKMKSITNASDEACVSILTKNQVAHAFCGNLQPSPSSMAAPHPTAAVAQTTQPPAKATRGWRPLTAQQHFPSCCGLRGCCCSAAVAAASSATRIRHCHRHHGHQPLPLPHHCQCFEPSYGCEGEATDSTTRQTSRPLGQCI